MLEFLFVINDAEFITPKEVVKHSVYSRSFYFMWGKEEQSNFTHVVDYNYFQHIQAGVSICFFLS